GLDGDGSRPSHERVRRSRPGLDNRPDPAEDTPALVVPEAPDDLSVDQARRVEPAAQVLVRVVADEWNGQSIEGVGDDHLERIAGVVVERQLLGQPRQRRDLREGTIRVVREDPQAGRDRRAERVEEAIVHPGREATQHPRHRLGDAATRSVDPREERPAGCQIRGERTEPTFRIGEVVQHADAERGFRSLAPYVTPGGTLFAWIYGPRRGVSEAVTRVLRRFTTRMDYRLLYALCATIAAGLRVFSHYPYRALSKIPSLSWLAE